jgi:phosphoserine aminotransferase
MTRVFNFSAGPATLPLPVLERVREELLEWQRAGMSVMEMSHRGKAFISIAERAEADLRALLGVPAGHRVLFLQGGAQLQFSAVPLNLLRGRTRADYVDTGAWSSKAIDEARRYCEVNVVASSVGSGYDGIPARETWQLDPGAAYLHYTPNETIGGVEFHWVPEVGAEGGGETGDVPLVADMSSNIFSRPVDVERFGLIYAGAQKNAGIAGLTIVIVREDLLGAASGATPSMLDYARQVKADSMANTAPTFAWYVAGLVFEWLRELGGLEAMAERNRRKAETLYTCIDASGFYANQVQAQCRSWMNVTFALADTALDPVFLERAREAGLSDLKGHRSVGGMRASIYNAMPQEGVDALAEFMREFERIHG